MIFPPLPNAYLTAATASSSFWVAALLPSGLYLNHSDNSSICENKMSLPHIGPTAGPEQEQHQLKIPIPCQVLGPLTVHT
jgi:hypothetical protein